MTARITDHALIRWLERDRGIDMELFRRQLDEIVEPFIKAGVAHAQIGGLWFVFKNDLLITVLPTRPDERAMRRYQGPIVNGTDAPRERLPWQARKRKKMRK